MGAKDQGRRIHPRPRDWGDFIQVPTFERLSNQSVGKNGYAIAASRPACRLIRRHGSNGLCRQKGPQHPGHFLVFLHKPGQKVVGPCVVILFRTGLEIDS
jgi:hypothetical protein